MVSVETVVYGSIYFGIISFGLFVFLALATPALKFLVARFSKNKVVIAIISRGNRLHFELADAMASGFSTKKHGLYDETASSMYITNKTPIYIAYEGYAHTQKLEWASLIKELRDKGFQINNFGDFQKLIKLAKSKELTKQYLDTIKDENKKKIIASEIKKFKEAKIEIYPGKTISFEGMTQMWPAIDDPHLREKEKAAESNIVKRLQGGGNLKNWLILLFIGGIIAFIMWRIFGQGDVSAPVEVVCKYPDIIHSASPTNLTL